MFSNKVEAKATNNCLDTSDICELLGVTRATVYDYVRKGKLKACDNLFHQRKLFYVDDFEQFLKENPKHHIKVYGIPPREEPAQEAEVLGDTEKPSAWQIANMQEPGCLLDPEEIKGLFDKALKAPAEEESSSDIALAELFDKLDAVEKLIKEHRAELQKLQAQKSALEQVIDMF